MNGGNSRCIQNHNSCLYRNSPIMGLRENPNNVSRTTDNLHNVTLIVRESLNRRMTYLVKTAMSADGSDESDYNSECDDSISRLRDASLKKRSKRRQCRICHSCDENSPMISPCLCKGSARWVHQACLQVRNHSPNQ